MSEGFVRRNSWALGIGAILGTAIVVNIFMVTVAGQSNVGYIEDKTWERDQAFQEQIDAQERFRRTGIAPQISVELSGAETSVLRVSLSGGTSLLASEIQSVTVTAKRGDDAKLDFTAMLAQTSSEEFSAPISKPTRGLWLMTVSMCKERETKECQPMTYSQRLFVD